MELTRYSVIRDKNPREIVLLRGRGCAWKRCKFCDYHLDASRDEQDNLRVNREALAQVTGLFGRLEAINSGSFAELDESTIREIERVCREKRIRDLHIESHWIFRKTIPALRERFAAQGVTLHVKIGVETFDADYRERVLDKGIDEADPDNGEVSWVSPIARVFLKMREGDTVKLPTPATTDHPARVETLEIVEVIYR